MKNKMDKGALDNLGENYILKMPSVNCCVKQTAMETKKACLLNSVYIDF